MLCALHASCFACFLLTCSIQSKSSCRQNQRLPLEALALLVDSLECKVTSLAPKLDGVQVSPLLWGHGLQDLELDGQAMAVPAGHIARPLALQQLILEDEVLQHLVQSMSCSIASNDIDDVSQAVEMFILARDGKLLRVVHA